MINVINKFLQYFNINDEKIELRISISVALILLIYIINIIVKVIFSFEVSTDNKKNTKIVEKKNTEVNKNLSLGRPRSFALTHDELVKSISERFHIRKIKNEDYDFGFLELLNHLSASPDLTKIKKEEFNEYLDHLDLTNKSTCKMDIYVIVDKQKNKIVSTATILFEKKFLHKFEKVAHVEDVVVSKDYRGKGLGKKIINHLIEESKNEGCYKVILNCKDENVSFYEKCSLSKKGSEMSIYFRKY